jgi:CBS domain-containing protein
MAGRFDLSFAPFDLLPADARGRLSDAADLLYFEGGEEILAPGAAAHALYVVQKGIVGELAGEEVVGVFREQDLFDSRALLAGLAENRFCAHEESLLLALPRQALLREAELSPAFGAHFSARISEKPRQQGHWEWQGLFNASIREAGVRSPVFLDAEASVADAARAMKMHKSRAVFVCQGDKIGIFTMSNFRDVVIDGIPADAPVAPLAQYQLHCCGIDEPVFSALLMMTRKNIQRVVVAEDGVPVGVLPQVDLLSFLSSHSHLLSRQIDQATRLSDLVEAGKGIDAAVGGLNATGMKTRQLARLVQALDLRLMERLWRLLAPPGFAAKSCLLVLGSGGRGEQILKTDQDNAIIHADEADAEAAAKAGEAFRDGMLQVGYPPCPGGIMASNPAWRGTAGQWQERIERWIYRPGKDTWMHLAAWLDADAAAGNAALLAACRTWLFERVQGEQQWLSWLSRAALQFDSHSEANFWQKLLHRNDSAAFDVKKGGIFPIVHGVRVLALENAILPTNTFERAEALCAIGLFDKPFAEDLCGALDFLMKLRLDSGLAALAFGKPASNLVDTGKLSSLARDSLKESLGIVRRFKAFLAHHYQLGRF